MADNDHFGQAAPAGDGSVIPKTVGGSSPIKHVIYVMKENRTYDQILGDLGRGNGDPSLAMFPEAVTPNQHALARQFVTLDNFYCDGEVSADGWMWSTASYANTYNQKNWPLDYSIWGRPYDFGGFANVPSDPDNTESAGFPGPDVTKCFLWDGLAAKGVSYRNYGFFIGALPALVPATMPGLAGHTDLDYSGWDLRYPDQSRVDEWLKDFSGFESSGQMPTVQLVYLPRDHTMNTASGQPAPTAMVADNDLALGRLVDAVSHSRFWPDTAIFVVEDDAQDGADHVDTHRTVAQVISPYSQLGTVDSTFYSTVSMLRTIELIVGVPPLTQFDAAATPMSACFSPVPEPAAVHDDRSRHVAHRDELFVGADGRRGGDVGLLGARPAAAAAGEHRPLAGSHGWPSAAGGAARRRRRRLKEGGAGEACASPAHNGTSLAEDGASGYQGARAEA